MAQSEGGGLFGAVLASAAKFGQQTAVVAGSQSLSYQQLAQDAGALARGLADLGVQRGDRVALLLPNCPQFVISYLAINALGAMVVPLHCQLSVAEAGDHPGVDDLPGGQLQTDSQTPGSRLRPAPGSPVPSGRDREVREAKRGKLGKVRALHGGRVARNGDAHADN
jgi:hypothetical protein